MHVGSKAFEGSKVVDAKGEPLTVYHGSNAEYDTMDPSQGTGGASWFTTDLGSAQSFGDAKLHHLNISNPLVLDMENPAKMGDSTVSAISNWAKENADNDGDVKIGSNYYSVGDGVDKDRAAEIVSAFKSTGGYPADEFITSLIGKSGHDGAELHNYEGNGVVLRRARGAPNHAGVTGGGLQSSIPTS